MLGTNCFSQAVAQLTADCRRMEQEAKTRLALSLMNCQLQVQQAQTYPCHRRHTIKECTEGLSDRAHALFVEFLTHADRYLLCMRWEGCAAAIPGASWPRRSSLTRGSRRSDQLTLPASCCTTLHPAGVPLSSPQHVPVHPEPEL